MLVTKDGLVRTNFDFSFGGFCLVEPEFFPYDSHYCLMEFAQTSNGVRLVNDQSKYPLVNPKIHQYHNTWWISKSKMKTQNDSHESSNLPAIGTQEITAGFIVVRKPEHAFSNILVPCYILSLFIPVAYLRPASDRISMFMTIYLTIIFITWLIEPSAAPAGDEEGPRLIGFVHFSTVQCIFGVVESVLMNFVLSLNKNDDKTDDKKQRKYCNTPFIIDFVIFLVVLTWTCCYIGSMHNSMTSQYPTRQNEKAGDLKQYYGL